MSKITLRQLLPILSPLDFPDTIIIISKGNDNIQHQLCRVTFTETVGKVMRNSVFPDIINDYLDRNVIELKPESSDGSFMLYYVIIEEEVKE